MVYAKRQTCLLLGSLSNDDGDANENGKKAMGLDSKTTTSFMLFLCISLPSFHDYNAKVPKFTFCRGREHKTTMISAIKFEV